MNILYLHGFGSCFKPDSAKVRTLEKLGPVHGIELDYSRASHDLAGQVRDAVVRHGITLLVGTSMGGWLAARMGRELNLPFVAANPAPHPALSLARKPARGTDHQGRPYQLHPERIATYGEIETAGHGLVLFDKADDVIDYRDTLARIQGHLGYRLYEGGSHRFEHMEEALPDIRALVEGTGAETAASS